MTFKIAATCAALIPLTFAGCASVDPQPAFVDLQKNISARTGQRVEWVRDAKTDAEMQRAIRVLLREELTADSAVRIALMNNRSLQATLAEIGISQADYAQATRLRNPEFAASVRFPDAAPRTANTEFSLVQDFLDLLILPLRKKVAMQELEQTKLRVTDEVLHLVAEVKTAFYNAQARQQLVGRLQLILEINEAAAELAKKQFEAGTIKELDFVNQQVTYNQSKRDVAHAQMQLRADRERLNRLLGLWGADTQWNTAEKLPPIPKKEIALESLESLALEQRADLAAARKQVEAISRALTLTRNTRFLPTGVKLGVNTEREPDRTRVTGPTLDLELPIFDQGQPRVARLEAQRLQAQAQLDAMTVNARSEVREAHALLLANRELADSYRTVLLPQRVKILELTLQQYNFMLLGIYDLLLAKQHEAQAERDYVEVWRHYWIARAELERAVGGKLPAPTIEQKKDPVTPQKPPTKPEGQLPKHEH